MAALAIALMEQVADAQNARNSCFPEAIASPVVGLLLMAVTAALDHWTLSGDNPIRALSLTLVQMLAVIGPLAAESTAAMAEGDFSWTEGSDQPSMQEIAQSMTELRTELELATDSMVRWRLEKDTESGTRADRRMYSAILAIEEMRYYDIFPALNLIQSILKSYQWRMQTALIERTQDRLQMAMIAGQQTQWYQWWDYMRQTHVTVGLSIEVPPTSGIHASRANSAILRHAACVSEKEVDQQTNRLHHHFQLLQLCNFSVCFFHFTWAHRPSFGFAAIVHDHCRQVHRFAPWLLLSYLLMLWLLACSCNSFD